MPKAFLNSPVFELSDLALEHGIEKHLFALALVELNHDKDMSRVKVPLDLEARTVRRCEIVQCDIGMLD